jgi:hypothetical protein
MNLRSTQISLGLGALAIAALGASSPHVTNPSPAIQQRIDALLKNRIRPEPLPVDPPNPFQMVSGGVRDISTDGGSTKTKASGEDTANAPATYPTADAPGTSSAEVLAGCVSRLKIGGIIRIRDQIQIVINDIPRKEGDVIMMDWNSAPVQLRVVRVQANQLTLRYGEADVILKY